MYNVICEKYGEEFSRTITVRAPDPYTALALAEQAYGDGWHAVDVRDVSDCQA